MIEVSLGKMLTDGYTPEVVQEDPIIEANLRNALANRIGLEDFYPETESGIFEDTLICRGLIPPKYLRILKDEGAL